MNFFVLGGFFQVDFPPLKTSIFITCERFARIASKTGDSQLLAPWSAIRKQGVQFGNPETIRENQAIRANLRIDSRESGHTSPEGLERHLQDDLDVARQKLPRDNFCRSVATQLPSPRGQFWKEEKNALSCGGEANWEAILRDNLGEVNCESRIAARQWGVSFCREASRCLAGRSGRFLMGWPKKPFPRMAPFLLNLETDLASWWQGVRLPWASRTLKPIPP